MLRDLDLIKTFPNARVAWSINTLDDNFRKDMDNAVSIERRLAAMKIFHEAKVRTTCFISPIFSGITDVQSIILQVKDYCNWIWLENLNLRGSYKTVIFDYIKNHYPHLISLYEAIYKYGDRSYWEQLDEKIRSLTQKENLLYVRDDDAINLPFDSKPIVVNYFFHNEITPSAKRIQNHAKTF